MKLRNGIPARSAWLVGVSLIAGFLATWGWVIWGNGDEPGEFEAPAILRRFLICSGISCAAMLLVPPVFRWLRPALCRLFCLRNLKRASIAGAVCFVLFAVLHLEENWRGGRAWAKFKREWEAKGERFDFASFIPPPVPDDQNFALTPIVASCYLHVLDRHGRRVEPENTNVVNRLKMDIYRHGIPPTTNMRLGSWCKSQFTALKAWQDHYRTPVLALDKSFEAEVREAYRRFTASGSSSTNGSDVRAEIREAFARRYGIESDNATLSPTNEFPIAAVPQSPAADVLLALSKYDSAIEGLRQASRLPYSRFPLECAIKNPAEMRLPHYHSLKATAPVLQLRAVAALGDAQPQNALADVQLLLYLADSIRGEPLVWSWKSRAEIVDCAMQPIWEGLARRLWSNDQLQALADKLASIDLVRDYSTVLRSERAWQLKLFDYLREERMENSMDCMCGEPIFWPTLAYRLSPNGWFYLNQLALAHCYQVSLPTSTEQSQRILSPGIARRSEEAAIQVRRQGWKPTHFLAAFVLPSSEREVRACARTQAAVDMAGIACALECYRLANRGYPETLEGLAPQFLGRVPRDVINGQPLKYRRTESGLFVLYSVGWDEKDDGGRVELSPSGLANTRKGDWVWRYPDN